MKAALPLRYSYADMEQFMRAALTEAEAAGHAGDNPIGAVLVIDGAIMSRGRSRLNSTRSQLAHAEMEALQAGGKRLSHDYDRALLVATVEPCPMCLGAAVMADVPHIDFASHDANVHTLHTVRTNPYVARHIQTYLGGVLETESRALIGRFNKRLLECVLYGSEAADSIVT